jgi:hypothetical protein
MDIKKFMLAGNATFTISNKETGNRFTFKVQGGDNKPHFVSVLTGPDNEANYTFIGIIPIGTIFDRKNFRYSKKSTIPFQAQSIKAFMWLWRNLDNLPPQIEISHAGKCGRCGRRLTVPESIEMGIGPECLSKI